VSLIVPQSQNITDLTRTLAYSPAPQVTLDPFQMEFVKSVLLHASNALKHKSPTATLVRNPTQLTICLRRPAQTTALLTLGKTRKTLSANLIAHPTQRKSFPTASVLQNVQYTNILTPAYPNARSPLTHSQTQHSVSTAPSGVQHVTRNPHVSAA
jgi:hypothetical protein